ncbi:MAG: GntR family transcriptional regulator [Clostridia bacterium]|nr:GntR family transcriptional regulator [Clostridia bacterium]
MNIDKFGRTPIYEQIVNVVEKEILTGVLKPMDQLPSVRELAMELSINPNTIQKAYQELERRGLCYSAPGQGRFVSSDSVLRLKEKSMLRLNELCELARELMRAGISEEEIVAAIKNSAENVGKENGNA